jgi:hypothetical protein
MTAANVTIVTVIDGIETRFSTPAEAELSSSFGRVKYQADGSLVGVEITPSKFTMQRTGDFSLFLCLKAGEHTNGVFGAIGKEGKISVFTKKLKVSLSERNALVAAEYELIFPAETQHVKIRMSVSA